MPVKLAIVGATGLVGRKLLKLLPKHLGSVELFLLASERSAGSTLKYQGDEYTVLDTAKFDFSQVDVAIFSAGKAVALHYAPLAVQSGCTVIDNSSAFRYQKNVPLIVPEINADQLKQHKQPLIIANPNCSTIQMVLVLKALHDHVPIKRVNVSTYQAVSGAGQEALNELKDQTESVLSGKKKVQKTVFPKPIAFNVIPCIDSFEPNGYTREEMKMVWESQKILSVPELLVNPTAVRVPVFTGHSMALHMEFEKPVTTQEARTWLEQMSGVSVMDDPKACVFPTPVEQGSDGLVYVGRIRRDISHSNGLNCWVVADNLLKGAALNAVQILTYWLRMTIG